MKQTRVIALLTACVIAGAVRYPQEGPQHVDDDTADRLIDGGMAEEAAEDEDETELDGEGADQGEDLDSINLAKLGEIVTAEDVPLDGATKKAEIIAAIRKHREAQSV